jgi:hypothetical protein
MKITTLILILLIANAFSQNQVPLSVFSTGGGTQTNSSYTLTGSVGLPLIGMNANTSFGLQSGFWQLYLQNVLLEVSDENVLPVEYKLEQNYPNPFNPSTIIKFGVPERAIVLIKIYDLLGSEVTTLVNQELDRGWYDLTFNATGLSSGFYIYRMKAGNYISTKKMLHIK